MYLQNLSEQLLLSAKKIKLLTLDVDGVLTDGTIYYSDQASEIKAFNTQDGLGIKLLHRFGIQTAIITGRCSPMVKRRAKELGIQDIFQASSNKQEAFQSLLKKYHLSKEEVAHVGDDLPDLTIMKQCGLGIAVENANWFVKAQADWKTEREGGHGAVRCVAELLLLSHGKLESIYENYLP